MIGSTALMTSEASVVSVAPCLIRSLVPAARGSSGEPGTANTSRPCSAAIRAVISDPERCAASTTTTPSAAPEISRLRRGKSRARGTCPSGISEIAAPPARGSQPAGLHARADRSGHARRPAPPRCRCRWLARCAAWSMPRARPETMTKPASPRSRASVPANFSPAPEALREPTTAIIGRISVSCAPRTPSSGGASSSVASRGG